MMTKISQIPQDIVPIYEIKAQGRFSSDWDSLYPDMSVTYTLQEHGPPATTLTGAIVDQAALRGIVNMLWDLNFVLISINLLQDQAKQEGVNQNECYGF
jgi:hypothetical protein